MEISRTRASTICYCAAAGIGVSLGLSSAAAPCSNSREVVVRLGSVEIARSSRTIRVRETASPPTFYIPPDDVKMNAIERAAGPSLCEWKGQAAYWTVTAPGQRLERVGWSYPEPFRGF